MCNKYSNIARQKKEKKKVQLTKDDAFVYWSSSYAVCWWPIFKKLGTCSTTDNLSPRTLLTKKNFCESVQEILQYRPAKKKKKNEKKEKVQLTKDDAFLYWSSSCAVCWWPIFRKLGTCSTTDALSPRTLLTENICESVQQILQHSPAKRKRKKKGSTHQRWCLSLLVLFLCSVLVADFQEAWHMLHDGRLVP